MRTATPTMNLSINNSPTSGVSSAKVFACVLGTNPVTKEFGYVDFANGTFVPVEVNQSNATFQYRPGVTSRALADIAFPFGMPAMLSARIYFFIGEDFPAGAMATSGPSPSRTTTSLFDKVEFDTSSSGSYNINTTSVDFYGVSLTIQAAPKNGGGQVTYGYTASRKDIINALKRVTPSPSKQHLGNTSIFSDCVIQSDARVLRVLSPSTMALSDWGTSQQSQVQNATLCSHFLDEYITQHCWAPQRSFSFYDKFWPQQKTIYYGCVTPDGQMVNLYTDSAMTQPYSNVPQLVRPQAIWPLPSFNTPSNYHRTSAPDTEGIDWGYLLLGNAAGGDAAAAWGSDPAVMAILVSICRGVMHLDNGTSDWVPVYAKPDSPPGNFYLGNGLGVSTPGMPIYYYSKILHSFGAGGMAYVLSYDDVYGQNTSIFFADGANVTINLNSLESVPALKGSFWARNAVFR